MRAHGKTRLELNRREGKLREQLGEKERHEETNIKVRENNNKENTQNIEILIHSDVQVKY